MVSEEADALAEMARNRGLKLVRSRVRTPGKRAFGKYGLTDLKGAKLLGLDGKHPSASADEIADFLRKDIASEWAKSLGVASPKGRAVRKAKPKPELPSPPPRKPLLRSSKPGDAEAIAALIGLLGHKASSAEIGARLRKLPLAQLVATVDRMVVGLCGLAVQDQIHRSKSVGRITILIVNEDARGQGIGRMLVEEAESRLKALGCGMLEITSNNKLIDAHHFYAHLGFDQTSKRFAKPL